MSLREKFKSRRPKGPIKVDDWPEPGDAVYVHPLSVNQSAAIAEANGDADGVAANLTMMVACVKDEGGQFVFHPGDELWLREKSAGELAPLLKAMISLNGVEAGVEAAKKN